MDLMDRRQSVTVSVNVPTGTGGGIATEGGSSIMASSSQTASNVGSVGIGQVQVPQPQTVQHHPPAPTYPQPVPGPQPSQSQNIQSPASLVSSGPTSPVDGPSAASQVVQAGEPSLVSPQNAPAGRQGSSYYPPESNDRGF